VNDLDLHVHSGQNGLPTHVVLAGSHTPKSEASSIIESQAMLIVKGFTSGSLPLDYALTTTQSGGTQAWRNHDDLPSAYSRTDLWSTYKHAVTGHGVVRQSGVAPVGAIYNDGGKNRFRGGIDITGDTWFGSRGDLNGYLALDITPRQLGTGSFTKVGPGLIIFSSNGAVGPSWAKPITLQEGVLRAHWNLYSLPKANIVLNGGILEYGANYANATYTLGTSSNNQIQWTGGGGFSAYGSASTVRINNTNNNLKNLTWGEQYFVGDGKALLLSSRYANNTITFLNPINLGSQQGALREIRVERALLANAYGILSGKLTGAATGLLKTGHGLLHLTATDNNYTGNTVIEGGALRGHIPTASRIVFDGGVLGLDADFTRSLGTGAGQVRWLGHGGFAAYGGQDRIVNIDNGAVQTSCQNSQKTIILLNYASGTTPPMALLSSRIK